LLQCKLKKIHYIPSQDELSFSMGELFCDVIPMPDQLV